MLKPLLAETLGTALLAVAAIGAVHSAASLSGGNGVLTLLPPALSVAAMLVLLITILTPVSGGHINPIVTLLFLARRSIAPALAAAYVLAQCLGAALGVLLVHAMFDLPMLQTGSIPRSGTGLWLSEAVAGFGLILTIIGGLRANPAMVPALVGGFGLAGYWFTASSGFSNPAVTLARSLTETAGGMRLADVPAYALAQLLGAALAIMLGRWLFAATPARG